MVAPASSRRGFLRGLTTLPLIGGSVALIGAPKAVAEPVTDALFDAYLAFITHEHREVLAEHAYRRGVVRVAEMLRQGITPPPGIPESCAADTRATPYLHWTPKGHEAVAKKVNAMPPSTRAALVLSTVGCDWREGGL